MKIAFHTLGCKVNQYETEAMKEAFQQRGHVIVSERDAADVFVINTCTVTSIADRKSRQFIRRMKKNNPDCILVATGCYVQTSAEELEQMNDIDIIAGINEKHNIPDYVERFAVKRGRGPAVKDVHIRAWNDLTEYEDMGIITGMESRTRAYIKIEEGCDRYCSYCMIPYARGAVRSRPEDDILKEAASLVQKGFKEITLTGINTALYRDLPALLAKMEEMEGDFRIRLSSLEPVAVNHESIKDFFVFERLCHHMHLSMQSGSDRILRAMNRPYGREDYFRIVDEIRNFDPDYGITTDIIVGFPGESEADFRDSMDAVQRCGFGKVHVFRYSERPGTAAVDLPDKVDPKIKKERAAVLTEAAEQVALDFHRKNTGKAQKVLFETCSPEYNMITGYTGNYMMAYCKTAGMKARPEDLTDSFCRVIVTGPYRDGVLVQPE